MKLLLCTDSFYPGVGGKEREKDAMTEAACADCRTGSDRAKRE